jgi:hypothetical protein
VFSVFRLIPQDRYWEGTARSFLGAGATRGHGTDERRTSARGSNRDGNESAPNPHIRRSGAV